MHRLIVENGPDKGRVYELDQPVATVGRSVTNHIQIVDRRMSRNHAELHQNGARILLKDLGSKNGTLVNGEPVIGMVELRQNDRISFGDTDLVYMADGVPGAPPKRRDGTDASGATGSDSTGHGLESSSPSSSSSSGFRVVEEQQWGRARNSVRAGFDPTQGTMISAPLRGATAEEMHELNRRLEVMYKVTDAVRSVFTLEELLNRIMEIIQSMLHPDRGYILLNNPATGELEPVVVKSMDTQSGDTRDVHISKSITQRAVNEGISLLVSDAAADMRFSASESVIMNRIRTAMVAPILYKNEALGVVYIDTQSRAMAFTNEELELLTSIANQAAVAIVNARLHSQLVEQHKVAREMEIARNIQMNLLPKTYPDIPGYQLSAMSLPAKQVGGDYYDFLHLPDGRLCLAIADVSGKGVSAAILTATTRSYLQSETQHPEISILQTMSRINRMVLRDVAGGSMYVTMVALYLDPVEGHFEFVNAGHAFPILLLPNGEMKFLRAGGVFLGIMDDVEFQSDSEVIPPGGVVVLYTDGVTDILSPEGEAFGNERFYELVRDKQHLSAEEIRNAIYQTCIRHRGTADQFDDFTLIVLKRLNFNESEID
ncbi:MAG: SpoIIE family protein phosphatase [Candidatus Sumerlaeia bacterium]|nr:SpoIIE family protein phosphatase [Candidatus Sumerlaeia bacterium]